MVQRKLPPNTPLQTDHVINKKNQFQDLRNNNNNKVADLKKKKMKKSGSIKRPPELDATLIPTRQPAKPPPAAVAPPPSAATTPNYMKPTTSSVARKEVSTTKKPQTSPPHSSSILRRRRSSNTSAAGGGGNKATKTAARALTKNPSFKPARKSSPVVVLCENLDSQRATCSSTLKDCKFPAFLSLNHGGTESEGTSKIKVCPYTYCSLNGHHHAPLPPLKCFLSARRRVIKNQRNVKLTVQDDLIISSRPLVVDEQKKDDFFVEIYCERTEDAAEETLDSIEDEIKSGFSSDFEGDYDYETGIVYDDKTDKVVENQLIIEGELITESNDKYEPLDEVAQESLDEDSLSSDAFSSSEEDSESIDSYHDYMQSLNIVNDSSLVVKVPIEEPKEAASDDAIINQETEDYYMVEDETPFDNQVQIELSHSEVAPVLNCSEPESETAGTAPGRTAGKSRKKPVEETDGLGIFDPRGPNFLPVEPDPEAERVDLRHQDLDERKNSEEWMVDFALRQVVTKLGPARKKRVSLLVEAFEKVIPIIKFDDRHLRHSSGFDQARPIQACN